MIASEASLLIRTSAPLPARIAAAERVGAATFDAWGLVTIEILNADLAPYAATAQWEIGPFIAARAVRFRTATECGVRIRLQARQIANWNLVAAADGIEVRATATRAASVRQEERANEDPGGAIAYSLHHAESATPTGDSRLSQGQIGFVQRIAGPAVVRGFFAAQEPSRTRSERAHGAVGVESLRWRELRLDAAAGDLVVGYGDVGRRERSAIHAVTLRGAAASAFAGESAAFHLFGGRAVAASLRRLETGEVVSELSDDFVSGAAGSWTAPSEWIGFGAGILHSAAGGADRWNGVVAADVGWRENASTRFAAEYARGSGLSGWAISVEPAIDLPRVQVDGYYRYADAEFQPPLGSGFFATLRETYGLHARAELTPRLAGSVGLGQSVSFSLLDPEDAGTVTQSELASLSWAATDRISASAFVAESRLESNPDVLVRMDSLTRSAGIAAAYRIGRLSADLRLSADETDNLLDPSLRTEAITLEGGVQYSFARADAAVRWRLADVDRGTVGSEPESGVSASARTEIGGWSIRGEAGYAKHAPGLALRDFVREHASIAVRSGSTAPLRAGLRLAFQRVRLGGERAHQVWLLTTDAGDLVRWGARAPDLLPPFANRAMPVRSKAPLREIAVLSIVAFVDENRDGARQPGEPLVAATVHVDGREISVGDRPERVTLQSGDYQVELIRSSGGTYRPAQRRVAVSLGRDERRTIEFALVPAGRLTGRVEFLGTEPPPGALQAIRIVGRSGEETLRTTTDPRGAFSFGLVPGGEWHVEIDRSTIPQGVAVEGLSSHTVVVIAAGSASVTFTIRRATARERFGVQP